MTMDNLRIWRPVSKCPYDTVYVQVYVSERNVCLTYKCRADVLVGDTVNITIKEEVDEYDWRPIQHVGDVVHVLNEQDVLNIRNEYWFDNIKLAVVCGREGEEPQEKWEEIEKAERGKGFLNIPDGIDEELPFY